MIELETMLMQFCLETSGRQNGDRYPVGKGGHPQWSVEQVTAAGPACHADHLLPGGLLGRATEGGDSSADRRVILWQRPASFPAPVTVLHGVWNRQTPLLAKALGCVVNRRESSQLLTIWWLDSALEKALSEQFIVYSCGK